MREGRPSFEVDAVQIELTYPIGSWSETLTRVVVTASGAFVYNGSTLLGGGLDTGVLRTQLCDCVPSESTNSRALAGPGSRAGDIVLSWV
jgi:hypothetical protein